MSDIKLSICITTLNRAELLKEMIDAVIEENNQNVELVISNGGCTDNTDILMKSYAAKYEFIKYINPQRKIGLDEGYHIALKESVGDFCWCMPDDDIITKGSLDTIIRILEEDIDLLIVNLSCYTNSLKTDLNQSLIPIKDDKSLSYDEFEKLFSTCYEVFSYIGTMILKRKVWLENDLTQYYNTWFAAYAAMASSKHITKIKYLSEPVILYRSACSSWSDHSFEIWHKIWPNHVASFELFLKYLNQQKMLKPWSRTLTLVKSRAMGEYNINGYKNIIRDNVLFTEKLKYFIIALIPFGILNIVTLVALSIIKREQKYSIYTMRESSKYPILASKITNIFNLDFE